MLISPFGWQGLRFFVSAMKPGLQRQTLIWEEAALNQRPFQQHIRGGSGRNECACCSVSSRWLLPCSSSIRLLHSRPSMRVERICQLKALPPKGLTVLALLMKERTALMKERRMAIKTQMMCWVMTSPRQERLQMRDLMDQRMRQRGSRPTRTASPLDPSI